MNRQKLGAADRKRTGLTLVELLVAVAILVTGILVVSRCFIAAVQSEYKLKSMTEARRVVSSLIEEMRSDEYAHLTSVNYPVTFGIPTLRQGTGTCTLTDFVPAPGYKLKKAVIEIRWGGVSSNQGRFRCATYIREKRRT